MPEMEEKNDKNTLQWLASCVTSYSDTAYSLFEDEWNKQRKEYNTLYKGGGITKQCLDKLLKKVEQYSNQKPKPDYGNATSELQLWTEILPALKGFCDAYNEVNSKAGKAPKKIGTVSKDNPNEYTDELLEILRSDKVQAVDYTNAKQKVDEIGKAIDGDIKFAAVRNQVAHVWPDSSNYSIEKCKTAINALVETTDGLAKKREFEHATKKLTTEVQPLIKAYQDYLGELEQADKLYVAAVGKVPSLKNHYSTVKKDVEDKPTTVKLLGTQTEAMKTFKSLVPVAEKYADLLGQVQREFERLKAMHPPEGTEKERVLKSNKQITSEINTAIGLADNKYEYAAAESSLQKTKEGLAKERTLRTTAVKEDATKRMEKSPQKALFEKLAGKVDKDGLEIVAALYTQFPGDSFAQLLEGFDVLPEDNDKSKATKHLETLCQSIGANGIGSLCEAFSGSGSGAKEGAKGVGDLLKKGVKDEQLSQLFTSYQDSEAKKKPNLKTIVKEGFANDTELFAEVLLKGLKGKSTDKDDLRVTNLKLLTDQFATPSELGQLMDGLSSKKGERKPRSDKQAAGKRMDDLLSTRFNGDPTKLKKPFFDNLNSTEKQKQDWVEELSKLRTKKTQLEQELENYNKLTDKEKLKAKKPLPFRQNEQDRLDHLNFILNGEFPYEPLPLKEMIRNATTFKTKERGGHKPALPKGCDSVEMNHFCRHTREHQTFDDEHLAPSDTTTRYQIKNTTLWPEDVTDEEIADYVESVLKSVSVPTVSELQSAVENRKTYPPGSFPKAGGYAVKIGFKLVKGKVVVDQFYPLGNRNLDSIDFYDMHAIKKALGV